MALSQQDTVNAISVALANYAAGDIEGFLSYLTDDVVYSLHLDETLYPFAGGIAGKHEFRQRLQEMRSAFDYIHWNPGTIRVAEDGSAKVLVEFVYKHKASGEVLDGVYRLVVKIRADRKVCRLEEYHDAPRVHAFARLMKASEK